LAQQFDLKVIGRIVKADSEIYNANYELDFSMKNKMDRNKGRIL